MHKCRYQKREFFTPYKEIFFWKNGENFIRLKANHLKLPI